MQDTDVTEVPIRTSEILFAQGAHAVFPTTPANLIGDGIDLNRE